MLARKKAEPAVKARASRASGELILNEDIVRDIEAAADDYRHGRMTIVEPGEDLAVAMGFAAPAKRRPR